MVEYLYLFQMPIAGVYTRYKYWQGDKPLLPEMVKVNKKQRAYNESTRFRKEDV